MKNIILITIFVFSNYTFAEGGVAGGIGTKPIKDAKLGLPEYFKGVGGGGEAGDLPSLKKDGTISIIDLGIKLPSKNIEYILLEETDAIYPNESTNFKLQSKSIREVLFKNGEAIILD